MRNYQTKSNQGALPDSITATRFGAGEFNSVAVELEGAVTTSGQTLAPADGTGEVTDQLAMALAIYGAGGATYHIDTGAVNAYVLTPVSPKESPNAYFNGFSVVFEPGTVNTTASTVNVGGLGVKSITLQNGTALSGGEISGTCCLKYNLGDDRFELIYSSDSFLSISNYYEIDATQADQGATSTNPDTMTIYDVITLTGGTKFATIHLSHNPNAGNQTLYTFDTSLDLSSYPHIKILIDNGAMFDRTTGDEIFTLFSSDSLLLGDQQQITSVDMLLFWRSDTVRAEWWGAEYNNTDDTDALQYAINSLNVGGTVEIPVYAKVLLSDTLVANQPVLLLSNVNGDVSSNTDGTGSAFARPIFIWDSVSNDEMFVIQPSTTGDIVFGGGAIGIEWDGNNVAGTAVHLDNTKFAIFDGKVRNVTTFGVLVDSVSGSAGNFSMKNRIQKLEFIYGGNAACDGAHGLAFAGDTVSIPGTQQYVQYVHGLVKDGYLVRIAETDSLQAFSIHGVVDSGGTGGAIGLINAGAQGSHNNLFVYVNGKVFLDNGLFGNEFLNYNSEDGGFYQLTGTSLWHGELQDADSNSARYKSHTYRLRDYINFKPGDFVPDGSITTIASALQFFTHSFPDAGTSTLSAVLSNCYDYENGEIQGLEFYYNTNGTGAGNLRMVFTVGVESIGFATNWVTPQEATTTTIAQAAQYTLTSYSYTFSSPIAYAKGDIIGVSIQRIGGDALDTATDPTELIGFRLVYVSDGPDSAGSGTYASIPTW